MAMLAQRFAALDKETNVAVQNFLKVNENGIYSTLTAGADLVKMETANILNNPMVNKLKTSVDSLLALPTTDLSKLSGVVTASLKNVLSVAKLPKELMADMSSKLTSFGGQIAGVVTSAMNLGKKVLCPILGMFDFLSSMFKFQKLSPGMLLGALIRALKQINKNLCSGSDKNLNGLMKAPTLKDQQFKMNSSGKTLLASAGLNLGWDSSKVHKDLMESGANILKYTKLKFDHETLKASIPDVNVSTVTGKIDAMVASGTSGSYQTYINDSLTEIKNGTLSSDAKEALVAKLDTARASLNGIDSERFTAMSDMRAKIMENSMVNLELRRSNIENSNVNEKLTSAYSAHVKRSEGMGHIDMSGFTDASDIATADYVNQVADAGVNNTAITNSNKTLDNYLVPTTSINAYLSSVTIDENDSHKPNEIPLTTSALVRGNFW